MPRGRPFPKGSGGRPKGAKNKVTATFKAALLGAFEDIGGQQALAAWASDAKNRAIFYQICGRLVPTEVKGSSDPTDEPVRHIIEHVYQDKP
jgi:hypothetical protein